MYFPIGADKRVEHPAHLRCSRAEAAFPGLKLLFQPRCQNRKALAGQAMMRSSKVSGWRITEPPSSFSSNIKQLWGACMLADGSISPAIWAQSCLQDIQTQFSSFLPPDNSPHCLLNHFRWGEVMNIAECQFFWCKMNNPKEQLTLSPRLLSAL